jgi:hypothetical protein
VMYLAWLPGRSQTLDVVEITVEEECASKSRYSIEGISCSLGDHKLDILRPALTAQSGSLRQHRARSYPMPSCSTGSMSIAMPTLRSLLVENEA